MTNNIDEAIAENGDDVDPLTAADITEGASIILQEPNVNQEDKATYDNGPKNAGTTAVPTMNIL